jgi:hypothetical protein
MGEKPSPSGEDFGMPRWGDKAEYPPPEGGGFERPCKLPPPEGGGIQGGTSDRLQPVVVDCREQKIVCTGGGSGSTAAKRRGRSSR